MDKRKTKHSAGIVLLRKNFVTNNYEVLMVKKRYTYPFYSIILEKNNRTETQKISNLLNKTTMEEKLILYDLNFDVAYRVVWNGTILDSKMFNNYKRQFYEEWVRPDNGKKFRQLIKKAKNVDIEWSLPKGRKNNGREKILDCAIREFTEETNIPTGRYRIYDYCKTYNTTDNNITYNCIYFLASPRTGITLNIDFANKYQYDEIKNISWVPCNQISHTRLYRQVIKPMKMYLKKNGSI